MAVVTALTHGVPLLGSGIRVMSENTDGIPLIRIIRIIISQF